MSKDGRETEKSTKDKGTDGPGADKNARRTSVRTTRSTYSTTPDGSRVAEERTFESNCDGDDDRGEGDAQSILRKARAQLGRKQKRSQFMGSALEHLERELHPDVLFEGADEFLHSRPLPPPQLNGSRFPRRDPESKAGSERPQGTQGPRRTVFHFDADKNVIPEEPQCFSDEDLRTYWSTRLKDLPELHFRAGRNFDDNTGRYSVKGRVEFRNEEGKTVSLGINTEHAELVKALANADLELKTILWNAQMQGKVPQHIRIFDRPYHHSIKVFRDFWEQNRQLRGKADIKISNIGLVWLDREDYNTRKATIKFEVKNSATDQQKNGLVEEPMMRNAMSKADAQILRLINEVGIRVDMGGSKGRAAPKDGTKATKTRSSNGPSPVAESEEAPRNGAASEQPPLPERTTRSPPRKRTVSFVDPNDDDEAGHNDQQGRTEGQGPNQVVGCAPNKGILKTRDSSRPATPEAPKQTGIDGRIDKVEKVPKSSVSRRAQPLRGDLERRDGNTTPPKATSKHARLPNESRQPNGITSDETETKYSGSDSEEGR